MFKFATNDDAGWLCVGHCKSYRKELWHTATAVISLLLRRRPGSGCLMCASVAEGAHVWGLRDRGEPTLWTAWKATMGGRARLAGLRHGGRELFSGHVSRSSTVLRRSGLQATDEGLDGCGLAHPLPHYVSLHCVRDGAAAAERSASRAARPQNLWASLATGSMVAASIFISDPCALLLLFQIF
jgi:hypothetical protein